MSAIDFAELDAYSQRQNYHANLRPYQQQNKHAIYRAWHEGKQSVMLQMPTGTGKTHLFASLIKDIQDYTFDHASDSRRGVAKVLVIAHRQELIEQIQDTLTTRYHHSCGIVTGQTRIGEARNVIVASVQTFSRRKRLQSWEEDIDFDFIIIDEAHHSTAESYQRIRQAWPEAKLLGVTATPYRLNHQPFTDIYDKLILSQPVYKFIEQGYLCNYEYYSIRPNSLMQFQIDHLKTAFDGDYDEQAMDNLLNQDRIRSGILQAYERFAKGKKGIVYTINRMHNVMLASLFEKEGGYRVAYIDSTTPAAERAQTVSDFRKGLLDIIFNVNIFSEGFDCPDVEFILLARPTKSLSMYLQQVGRGFRTAEGKEKVIYIDNVGLYNRFGLPSARRHWQHHFEGRDDWEEDSVSAGNPLDEHEYTPADLSEGNEEMQMVYTSIDDVEPAPPAQEEPTTADNQDDMITKIDNEEYDLTNASMEVVMRVLLKIEDEKHTGMIDSEGIRQWLDRKRTESLHALRNEWKARGFTDEDIRAALAMTEPAGQSRRESTHPRVAEDTAALPPTVGKGLYVKLPDGSIIQERKDKATFIKAIQTAGVEHVFKTRVATLGAYLVGTKPHPSYRERSFLVEGYYIVVNHSNKEKVKLLQEISDKLGLQWEVGVHE